MIKLKELLSKSNIKFIENQQLSVKSTFKIGSTADIFIAPENIKEFQQVLNITETLKKDFFILGGGSNIVFPDTPFHKVIISTENLKAVEELTLENSSLSGLSEKNKVLVKCQSGTAMASFVNYCTEHSLSGAEEFAGLPGSVGGAVFMNARCFNKSINEIFYSASYLDMNEQEKSLIKKELKYNISDWDYKKSPFQGAEGSQKGSSAEDARKIITEVTFILTKMPETSRKDIEINCKKYISERVAKGHFKYPSAGSVFKNNRSFGKPSGQLIDEAGLKGFTSGGAKIAPFHGNFIININKATSKDVKYIVGTVQKIVKEKSGFMLEPEIIFL